MNIFVAFQIIIIIKKFHMYTYKLLQAKVKFF